MNIVDLSHVIEPSPPEVTKDFLRTDVSYQGHDNGAREFEVMFGVPPRLFRDQEGPAGERLSIGTHASTHVDAPWHYNSQIQGRRAATIDELPIERFFGPGVVIDATENADDEVVATDQIKSSLKRSGHALEAGDIVLVHTGRDRFYASPDYMHLGPGVTPEATLWLVDQGVRVVGIDAWGWDAPLRMQAQEAIARDEQGIFWGAHQIDRDYCQIERLTNLSALPATGFEVACFPLKIKGASAGPARVVAFVD